MRLVIVALALQLGGGLGAALVRGSRRWATLLGVGGAVLGGAVGLVSTVRVLLGGPPEGLRLPWPVPYGSFTVELDALSALFLLPVLALSGLAAVYGSEYVLAHEGGQAPATSWFFFDLLVASMVLVLIARNAVLFLVGWELMALASFFLVTADEMDASVREAGWTYLVATHLGTACLLVLFVLLGGGADPLDFDRFAVAPNGGVLFLLAVVGFGTKAGLMPLHVWLPEAHPAAPSHVSAVMSGVMIKTGIYGLVRVLTLAGPLPEWCGWVLVAAGAGSGVLGILSALGQRDMKRLLAYSSVENLGIIALALGLGLVGLHAGATRVAVVAFAAAFLHVINHAAMKGLLFLGAGAVAQQTGTRRLDMLGGLLRRLPQTGTACLAGSVAIAGLPPLNGFASEVLLFLGAYGGTISLGGARALPAVVTIGALALIGGLAAACFAMLFGIVFLGEPRSEAARRAREPAWAMRAPLVLLAAACVLLGAFSPLLVRHLEPVLVQVTALPPDVVRSDLAQAVAALAAVVRTCIGFVILIGVFAAVRRWLLARRPVLAGPTWDCGYAMPSTRMQYTASSFSRPLTITFGMLLAAEQRSEPPRGFFPRRAFLVTEARDLGREWLYAPAFRAMGRGLARFRWLQHGQVHLYVLYIALTLIALLLWIGPA
jgi:hydrogenase-4 component B